MHRGWAEGRQADRDILGALRMRSTVAHPFTAVRDYRLSGADVQDAPAVFHAQRSAQHDGELVELGLLDGLRMCATLSAPEPVFTWPIYSSTDLFPGTAMRVGAATSVGISGRDP